VPESRLQGSAKLRTSRAERTAGGTAVRCPVATTASRRATRCARPASSAAQTVKEAMWPPGGGCLRAERRPISRLATPLLVAAEPLTREIQRSVSEIRQHPRPQGIGRSPGLPRHRHRHRPQPLPRPSTPRLRFTRRWRTRRPAHRGCPGSRWPRTPPSRNREADGNGARETTCSTSEAQRWTRSMKKTSPRSR